MTATNVPFIGNLNIPYTANINNTSNNKASTADIAAIYPNVLNLIATYTNIKITDTTTAIIAEFNKSCP